MSCSNRKGVIGFLVTLALGVAVGAATLVVGNEVAKGIQNDGKNRTQSSPSSVKPTAGSIDAASRNLTRAQKDYYRAVYNHSEDINAKAQALKKAQAEYDELQRRARRNSSSGSGTSSGVRNPYSDDPGTITPAGGTNPRKSVPAPDSGNKIGLEYYKVKSGDTLADICQRYYGNGGMWTHILKYQIPSIAASPNLIFPGQLIALPKTLGSSFPQTGTSTGSTGPGNPLPTASKGDESWQERFQKDNLMSDFTLTNTDTMTPAQIQSFLESKGSVLAKPYRGSQPSRMIYNAAKKYGINPQVLLTRLQCEQGLVSKKNASQKELDWALGVGAYDSGNWNQKFKGFDKQVEGAAATYKRHYQDAKAKLDKGQPITMTIDGQQVMVKTAATYAAYKYTPHFNGSKLFFDVWRGFRKSW